MGQGPGSLEKMGMIIDKHFWAKRSVLITGHTGFKGAWLAFWLKQLSARISGYALPPLSSSLYSDLKLETKIDSTRADIRDYSTLKETVARVRPDVIFHLAAQPLVIDSYKTPRETWEINVLGSANLLAAIHETQIENCTIVFITTDKVYEITDEKTAYDEERRLGGHDPYSASKAACELLASSWYRSFFMDSDANTTMATARAGNVIGGGDSAENRIVPDLARALSTLSCMTVRNPSSVRPWQHVLSCLHGYIVLAEGLSKKIIPSGHAYNFGPNSYERYSVQDLLEEAQNAWPVANKNLIAYNSPNNSWHESAFLSLSIEKAFRDLSWKPVWDFKTTVQRTMAWYQKYCNNEDAAPLCQEDIKQYMLDIKETVGKQKLIQSKN